MNISFHGADQGVTGSCHLVECAGARILVDCGLYQGGRSIEEENAEPFGFAPSDIDALLLTHAHLDHCGRIPLLARRGFRGEIITTPASRELARLVMLDAANLQEEEAARNNRRAARHGRGRRREEQPLYSVLDALNSLDAFGRCAAYGERLEVVAGVHATFLDAGHILGSASILLELEEGGQRRRLLFSGDLGNRARPLLRDPEVASELDVIVMETTYGDRAHKALQPTIDEFYEAINATFRRGGNVIVPTFAMERAQELLYFLRQGVERGILSQAIQVFLDSPMAISATEIFRRHPEAYGDDTRAIFQSGQDPFQLPGLHFTRETADSMALNRIGGGAVIMAGSGMCTGGRIRHHLKHHLWRRDSSIVFVGFAARGTLARRIVDGADSVRIFGEEIPVHASIHTINGFSAHADRQELLDWYRRTGGAPVTYLVHGDADAMQAFADLLTDTDVRMPALHDCHPL
ncbi:MBL fold metallo-hydrolase RNA specificity domain-containing protein [Halomonas nitroreducens]|uniref:MBL fold metallo-hydrolase n=1 Tax=Halomonas nitroreducens TaxID=447425 RepID=A0A3S0J6G8_9GAMM|nr:MBL fold metallo-hydrolase [Halomonas nitroreducens]RTQ97407.1 MBL fold metallo-hydrolase [Halomonas nitroreducens]